MFKLFKKKEDAVSKMTYQEFWDWFATREKEFHKVVVGMGHDKVEKDFFNHIKPKLDAIRPGFLYLSGRTADNVAELIITPDGNIKNIVFCEELVNAAPKMDGWLFTALKPELADVGDFSIDMAGVKFGNETLSFAPINDPNRPDEIGIKVWHQDYNAAQKDLFTNGIFIYLDNFLGELNFVATLDNVIIAEEPLNSEEAVPFEKLKNFVDWREKEFIEKYEGTRRNTEEDGYSTGEMELENGNPLLAVVNADLMKWELKASHPWMMNVAVEFNGKRNNGMPDQEMYELLNQVEDDINNLLKDEDGYLNVARETGDNMKVVFYACKEFRKASKALTSIQEKYPQLDLDYAIFKDKYWTSLDRYSNLE